MNESRYNRVNNSLRGMATCARFGLSADSATQDPEDLFSSGRLWHTQV